MDKLSSKVCIIGAGPAGLAAALSLSHHGIPFTLIDKDRFPRSKICGDGLSGNSLTALQKIDPELIMALHQAGFAKPSWGINFSSPSLKTVHISFKEENIGMPPGYVIPRRDFDDFLLKEVRKIGQGTVLEETQISEIRKEISGYTLLGKEKEVVSQCRLLLVATGFDPSLIRQVSPEFPPLTNEALGIRAYFENITGFEKENHIEIHFLKELLPCYLWIFPLGEGKANVGLALPSDRIRTKKIILKDLLFQLLESYPHLKKRFQHAAPVGKFGAHKLPFFQGKVPVSGPNHLLLGDAARLVDPFSGEGIGNAMASGIIAAEIAQKAILTENYSAENLYEYDTALYSKLEKELMLGLKLQDIGKNAMLINLVIGKASRSKKMRNLLRDILFGMNSMNELGKPLFYAKLMLGIE